MRKAAKTFHTDVKTTALISSHFKTMQAFEIIPNASLWLEPFELVQTH